MLFVRSLQERIRIRHRLHIVTSWSSELARTPLARISRVTPWRWHPRREELSSCEPSSREIERAGRGLTLMAALAVVVNQSVGVGERKRILGEQGAVRRENTAIRQNKAHEIRPLHIPDPRFTATI